MGRSSKILVGLIVFFMSGSLVVFNNINGYYTFIAMCLAILSVFTLIDSFYYDMLEEPNENFELTVKSISKLFSLAAYSIKIHSATFAPNIYFDPRVFNDLKAAKKRGVKIEIILSEPGINPRSVKPDSPKKQDNFRMFWSWADAGTISVIHLNERQYPHFIIVDDIHVRVEKKHKITIGDDPKQIKRKAITRYIDVDTAEKHLKSFNLLKSLNKMQTAI
ncbi:hypothetical protein [Desulfonema magnum]|uniref:Uncharacterized protein n=1 Tax=Desulfonema magnum TaxID=45655 RepID=A0A975BMQ9_9BACT|nr:hypothetical protein [Desulfonema magnum]QTA88358.1 Uncharacterized protein dnm_044020 [Desulfonema magnum]